MRGGKNKGFGMLVLFLITGVILGGILGEVVSNWSLGGLTPYLIKTYPIFDLSPVVINLFVVKVVIGLALHPNIISVAGMVVAIIIYRRL